jgi:glycine oxidase
VDPRALCLGLERAATRCGCNVETGAVVRAVETAGDGRLVVRGVRSDGASFALVTTTVVLAAGAWSMHELTLPIERLSLRPVKGQLVRLRGAQLLRHVVRTPHVYIVPRADGQLLIGATMEEMGFDTTPTAGATMDLLRRSWQALPGIYDLEFVEVSVGLRSAVDDHLPVVGATEVPGLYLACGHFRHGVLLAPATAHYLARWIVEQREPAELSSFAPRRIAGTETAHPA